MIAQNLPVLGSKNARRFHSLSVADYLRLAVACSLILLFALRCIAVFMEDQIRNS